MQLKRAARSFSYSALMEDATPAQRGNPGDGIKSPPTARNALTFNVFLFAKGVKLKTTRDGPTAIDLLLVMVVMAVFRADLYVRVKLSKFDLTSSSQLLLEALKGVAELRNLQMTRVTWDTEAQGKVRIEEWYEMSGAIAVPEGGKAFWVLCKGSSTHDPYNLFMRLDRNITASDYDSAQRQASDWVEQVIVKPLRASLAVQEVKISSPIELSKKAQTLRGSR
jgi:hypothetical protein